MFYFCGQTGVISKIAPSYSNFYIYSLPESARGRVEKAREAAVVGSSGLEYQVDFLKFLADTDMGKK